MKKTSLALLSIAGLAGTAAAEPLSIDWALTADTVHAEFSSFAMFSPSNAATADSYVYTGSNGNVVAGGIAGADAPDLMSLNGNSQRFSDADGPWIETTAQWDLSLWSPAISGFDTQVFYLEISYFDNEGDPSWRQNYDLGISLYNSDSTQSSVVGAVQTGESYDAGLHIVTEQFIFTVKNAAEGIFIDLGSKNGITMLSPSLITAITLDTTSYNAVPEPSTYALFGGVGALLLAVRRRKAAAAR
jgi:hypothetical protein